ncbi:hypothetical protein [Thermococcus sp.]|uniref:hypothetical protein n=1 Tax=Thermococcus sp. TaxID=35749 RepID=UPI002617EC07|nr:hypothetical protein [Thermococcus sp.]
MKSRVVSYWLLASLAFSLTGPGAVAFANWDAPYGFYKDLSVWLGCAGSFLLLMALYGLMEWRRTKLSLTHPTVAGIMAAITIAVGYLAEGFIGDEAGYGSSNILTFIIGGFFGLALSLMLLPGVLLALMTGDLYQPNDRPLLIAWLVSLAVSLALFGVYLEIRRAETKGRQSQAP